MYCLCQCVTCLVHIFLFVLLLSVLLQVLELVHQLLQRLVNSYLSSSPLRQCHTNIRLHFNIYLRPIQPCFNVLHTATPNHVCVVYIYPYHVTLSLTQNRFKDITDNISTFRDPRNDTTIIELVAPVSEIASQTVTGFLVRAVREYINEETRCSVHRIEVCIV